MGKWVTNKDTTKALKSYLNSRDRMDEIVEIYVNVFRIKAWLIRKESNYFWSCFDDFAVRGPFETLAAAKLACEITADLTNRV